MKTGKPRLQGLEALTAEQRSALHQWLRDNLEYEDIRSRMLSQFAVKTSTTALCDYRARHVAELATPPESAEDGSSITIEIRPPRNVKIRIITNEQDGEGGQ